MGKTILYLCTIIIFFLVFLLIDPQDAFSISISSIDWGLSSTSYSTDNPHAIFYYSFTNEGDIRNRFYVTGIVEDPNGYISAMTPRRIYLNPGEIGEDMLTWNPRSIFPPGKYSAEIIIWKSEDDYEENKNRLFTDRIINVFVLEKPLPPKPKFTYYNTFLSLQVIDGSNPGYIKVKPTLTESSGNNISTLKLGNKILIYVDGNYKTKVDSNQWSSNIYTGSDSHTIRADFTYVSFPDSSVAFRGSSDTVNYFVSGGPVNTYYDTQLSLQVIDGSNPGYIKIKPTLTYDSGNTLSTTVIKIYVDGISKISISSNQWSSNIYTDSGSHTIKANFLERSDSSDSSIKYRSSSYTENYFVSGGGSSGDTFPVEYVIVGIIVIAVIAGVAVALSKRKKTAPLIPAQPAKVQTATDDTQFWVCPRCGRDLQMKSGRQFCPSCNVYH